MTSESWLQMKNQQTESEVKPAALQIHQRPAAELWDTFLGNMTPQIHVILRGLELRRQQWFMVCDDKRPLKLPELRSTNTNKQTQTNTQWHTLLLDTPHSYCNTTAILLHNYCTTTAQLLHIYIFFQNQTFLPRSLQVPSRKLQICLNKAAFWPDVQNQCITCDIRWATLFHVLINNVTFHMWNVLFHILCKCKCK